MKTSFIFIFPAVLCMCLLTNCRTGDDGTNNHGKATEGIDDRLREKFNKNDEENPDTSVSRDELADTTDRFPKL